MKADKELVLALLRCAVGHGSAEDKAVLHAEIEKMKAELEGPKEEEPNGDHLA